MLKLPKASPHHLHTYPPSSVLFAKRSRQRLSGSCQRLSGCGFRIRDSPLFRQHSCDIVFNRHMRPVLLQAVVHMIDEAWCDLAA